MGLETDRERPMNVAFLGNIAGNAYAWSKVLRADGVPVSLYLDDRELDTFGPGREDGQAAGEKLPEWIHHYEGAPGANGHTPGLLERRFRYVWGEPGRRKLVRDLLSYDLVHSFSGSLFFNLRPVWEFGLRRRRPYIACATGSDLREVAMSRGVSGRLMRLFFQRAARTLLLNLDMVDLTERAGLVGAEFFPFMIDTEKYSPGAVDRAYGSPDHLLFFMASHLDWGVVDNAAGRNSTKGNDRFIKAFARYVSERGRAHAVILDRGSDHDVARELIAELGISQHVTVLPEMRKDELVKHYRMADVVVDQFDVGAFGTLGLEAMSCGKPVMIYINNSCADRCYPERPPVLNARTEEDIFHQIELASDASFRQEKGAQAREWILKYHEASLVADRLIDIYEDAIR